MELEGLGLGLELGLGVGLGASKLLIADCRYATHGNRVPVAGTGYTTYNMDCSMDTNASAVIGKNENVEYCCASIIIRRCSFFQDMYSSV